MGAVISFGLIFLGTLCSTGNFPFEPVFFGNGLVLCNPSIQSWRYQTSSLLQKRVVGTMIFAVADATRRGSCVMFYVVSRYTYKMHQESSREYTPVNSVHQRLWSRFISLMHVRYSHPSIVHQTFPLSWNWGSSDFSSSRPWGWEHDKLMSPVEFFRVRQKCCDSLLFSAFLQVWSCTLHKWWFYSILNLITCATRGF